MARPATIDEQQLIDRLTGVFRDVGFEGATLADLARASGLKKASLYYRFPKGKEQMAAEVLSATGVWLERHILQPLRSSEPPKTRVRQFISGLNTLYRGGRLACLLNMLSSPRTTAGPRVDQIKQTFEALVAALTQVALDAGVPHKEARWRAQRAVILIQGSLVLARGIGSDKPFKDCLMRLEDELLPTRIFTREPE